MLKEMMWHKQVKITILGDLRSIDYDVFRLKFMYWDNALCEYVSCETYLKLFNLKSHSRWGKEVVFY